MEITEVRVFPVSDDKLKAFVSVTFDDCFAVCDIKIIEGGNGLFVSMPSKRRRNGTFRDVAHPLNTETRMRFEERILDEYRASLEREGIDRENPGKWRKLDASQPTGYRSGVLSRVRSEESAP